MSKRIYERKWWRNTGYCNIEPDYETYSRIEINQMYFQFFVHKINELREMNMAQKLQETRKKEGVPPNILPLPIPLLEPLLLLY